MIQQENGFKRRRALESNRFPTVLDDPPPHYAGCSYWSVVKPLATDVVNLICNGSFERNVDGWGSITPGTTLSRLPSAVSGAYRMRVVPATVDGFSLIYGAGQAFSSPFSQIMLPQDHTMYASVSLRASPGDKVDVYLIIDDVGGSYPYRAEGKRVTVTGNGQFQQVNVSYTAIAHSTTGITQVPIGLRIDNFNTNRSNTGGMDVDAVIMTQDIQCDYFDGDSGSGFGWLGTPHASQSIASRYSRTYGIPQNLTDLGFDIYSDSGWGYTPIEHVVTSFAQLNGSHYQKTRLLPRTITINAVINACCSPTTVHKARKALIDAMSYKFEEICTEEMLMIYQVKSECCGALSYPIGIRCNYLSGLEGLRNNPYFEKLTLSFVANNDPTFFDIYESSGILSNLNSTGTILSATGNAPMYPLIELRAGGSDVTVERIINDTPQLAIGLGVPSLGYTIPANNYLIIDTDPRSFGATLYPSNTNVSHQINFPNSNAAGKGMMLPGSNNWRAEWTTPNVGQELIIRWRNRFLSADSLVYLNGCSLCCGAN